MQFKFHVEGAIEEKLAYKALGEEELRKKRLRNTRFFSVLQREIALGPRTSPNLGELIC